jgi:hypothetical protein
MYRIIVSAPEEMDIVEFFNVSAVQQKNKTNFAHGLMI